ncbi:MAG: FAD-binding oxidoreductase [Bacteroidota bacterium]|nr:FAD-binding oxidoreductase [Bacteroidota bacterium]
MQVDYLIVGQGICGTLLSWFLHKEGKSFLVIDDERHSSSSQIAAGIINPVTGRRYVYTWMIDTVMPFALDTYKEMGEYLNIQTVFSKSIIDFFPSPQMRNAFIDRLTEDDTFLHSYPDQNFFNQYFKYGFGCGEIRPAYIINMQLLMAAWRKKLYDLDAINIHTLKMDELKITPDGITYQNITAEKIIFCDGIASAKNPWFELLPFSPNKGEALIIESAELTNEHIFKKGLMIAPLSVQNTYWVGSNYQWEFQDDHPTEKFFQQTKYHLEDWLKIPFKILLHKAAVRPATLERRPFVGFHPQQPALGILNGMGAKGASLAPFFANQLTSHLVHNFPIHDEADIKRYTRILSK